MSSDKAALRKKAISDNSDEETDEDESDGDYLKSDLGTSKLELSRIDYYLNRGKCFPEFECYIKKLRVNFLSTILSYDSV